MAAKARIMVVDNDPEWRSFVAHVLRQAGHVVELYNDVQKALQTIRDDDFDLIVVDAPLLNLLNLLAGETIRHRLLVVSGAPSVPEAISAYRWGALDYINKAFGEATLLQTVTGVLKKPPAQQRAVV